MRARHVIRAAALSFVLSLEFLVGCGTQQRFIYDKPGVTAADARRDESECVQGALTQDVSGRILTLVEIDREAYARCMQARGYTARPAR
jgi:hypothetical protein